jgi:hypothetical protein
MVPEIEPQRCPEMTSGCIRATLEAENRNMLSCRPADPAVISAVRLGRA